MDHWYMMSKDVKNVNGNPVDLRPILVLYAAKQVDFYKANGL